jgi:predicted acyl esterase
MVRITMRDGARLNGTLLFPKGKPRNDLPTVLIFFPCGIEGATQHFMVQSLLANGYAIAIVNERGRYYSDGTYTFQPVARGYASAGTLLDLGSERASADRQFG